MAPQPVQCVSAGDDQGGRRTYIRLNLVVVLVARGQDWWPVRPVGGQNSPATGDVVLVVGSRSALGREEELLDCLVVHVERSAGVGHPLHA